METFLSPVHLSEKIFWLRRMESALRSHSRPVLHGAVRVVQEMGKSRAAAFGVGLRIDEDSQVDDDDGMEGSGSFLCGVTYIDCTLELS